LNGGTVRPRAEHRRHPDGGATRPSHTSRPSSTIELECAVESARCRHFARDQHPAPAPPACRPRNSRKCAHIVPNSIRLRARTRPDSRRTNTQRVRCTLIGRPTMYLEFGEWLVPPGHGRAPRRCGCSNRRASSRCRGQIPPPPPPPPAPFGMSDQNQRQSDILARLSARTLPDSLCLPPRCARSRQDFLATVIRKHAAIRSRPDPASTAPAHSDYQAVPPSQSRSKYQPA